MNLNEKLTIQLMSKEWLMRLETLLGKSFKDLLYSNRKNNLSEIEQEGMLNELIKEREKIKVQAYKLRKDLLNISENVKEWQTLHQKAKASNAHELAKKASDQIKKLMKQGENLWEKLEKTGTKCQKIESKIRDCSKQIDQTSNFYEDEWIQLETELELDRLRQKNDLCQ